eukprot:6017873-Pyramimonas_sp.AAC.1
MICWGRARAPIWKAPAQPGNQKRPSSMPPRRSSWRKTRAQGESHINTLPGHLRQRLLGPAGSRRGEWPEICAAGPGGAEAMRVHGGAAAAEIYRAFPSRTTPLSMARCADM